MKKFGWLTVAGLWALAAHGQSPWWLFYQDTLHVPLAVHIIYDTFFIMGLEAQAWLDALNQRLNELDTAGLYPWEKAVASTPHIQLLPTQSSDENYTPLFTFLRYRYSGGPANSYKPDEVVQLDTPFQSREILNIWIARLDSPFIGATVMWNGRSAGWVVDYRHWQDLNLHARLFSEWLGLPAPLTSVCPPDTATCAFHDDGLCDIDPLIQWDSCASAFSCFQRPPAHNYTLTLDSTCPGFWSQQQSQQLRALLLTHYAHLALSTRAANPFGDLSVQDILLEPGPPGGPWQATLFLLWRSFGHMPVDTVQLIVQHATETLSLRKPVVLQSSTWDTLTVTFAFWPTRPGWDTLVVKVYRHPYEYDSFNNVVRLPIFVQQVPLSLPWRWHSAYQSTAWWLPQNPDFGQGWQPGVLTPMADSTLSQPWMFDGYEYACRGCRDRLISPWFQQLDAPRYLWLTYAYAKYDPYHADTLRIWMELSGGAHGRVLVWQAGGRELQTTVEDQNQWWRPSHPSDWRTVCIPLLPQPGDFRIVIETVSDYGNNLWLGAVAVGMDSCPPVPSPAEVPIPAHVQECRWLPRFAGGVIDCPSEWVLTDITGQVVARGAGRQALTLPAGYYLLRSLTPSPTVQQIIVP